MTLSKKMRCGVLGAKGYSGQQLCQLLLAHTQFQLTHLFSRDLAWRLASAPQLPVWPTEQLAEICQHLDLLFLATPADVSAELAPIALATGVKVIDLSGAGRLPDTQSQKWYGLSGLYAQAVYGLQPFCKAKITTDTRLVANPGCYATAAQMALVPLARTGLLNEVTIIIDAKSGVSGAGKKAAENVLFCELSDNFYPYKIGQHQHTPEIENSLSHYAGQPISVLLNTQLLPVVRGIAMTIYLNQPLDPRLLHQVYQDSYHDYDRVKIQYLPKLSSVQQSYFLGLTTVTRTPNTNIGYQIVGEQTLLFVTLDNLMKGAASQAIENAECLLQGVTS